MLMHDIIMSLLRSGRFAAGTAMRRALALQDLEWELGRALTREEYDHEWGAVFPCLSSQLASAASRSYGGAME